MLRKFLIVFPPVEKKERSVPSKKEKKKVRGLTDTGRKRVPRRTEVGKTGPPPSFFLLFESPFIPPPPAHEGAGERRDPTIASSLSLCSFCAGDRFPPFEWPRPFFYWPRDLDRRQDMRNTLGEMWGPHNGGRTAAINFLKGKKPSQTWES